jgi:hypothetical protein
LSLKTLQRAALPRRFQARQGFFFLAPPALNYRELAPTIRGRFGGHSGRNGERGVHKLRNGPSTIRHTNGLRWRRAQGLMNPAEIVVGNVQRDRRAFTTN